jgi:hypothetical protein
VGNNKNQLKLLFLPNIFLINLWQKAVAGWSLLISSGD